MKARENRPCFFLSTNLCRCGFTPSGIKGSQARSKNRYNQKRKKQGTGRRKPKSESKQNAPFQADRTGSQAPAPAPGCLRFARLSLCPVCPSLAGYGLPGSAPLGYGLPLPRRGSAVLRSSLSLPFPVGRLVSPALSALGGSGFPSLSVRSGFPSLGGSGFPGLGRCRFALVQPGAGAGAWLPGLCALPGLLCVPGRFRPP